MSQLRTESLPRVAVLIVSFNGRPFLEDCLRSLLQPDVPAEVPGIDLRVLVVDNASEDDSLELIHRLFPPQENPRLTVIASPENLGFTGGNNLGWTHLCKDEPAPDYLCLLNQDTIVEPGCLELLAETLTRHPEGGAAQPKILLHPRTDLVNTAGNDSHYLGFGFTSGYLQPDTGSFDDPRIVAFPSGAAVLLRSSVVPASGPLDPEMFLYLEDAELGWRLRSQGFVSLYVPEARVQHKYRFDDSFGHYYFLERNRWWLLLTHYRLATLLLLAPPLLFMELGQLYFSWAQGRLRDKLRSYGYFLSLDAWRKLIDRRRWMQACRSRGDRFLTAPFLGRLDQPELASPLVKYCASPLFAAYWHIARRLIFW